MPTAQQEKKYAKLSRLNIYLFLYNCFVFKWDTHMTVSLLTLVMFSMTNLTSPRP